MTTIVCEAGQFQKFIAMIRTTNDECRIHVSEDGLKTRLVDTGNFGMVSVHLKSSACMGFKYNAKAHSEAIGFDLLNISRLISAAKKTTPLTIKLLKNRISISYDEIEACILYRDINTIRKDPNPPNIVLDTTFTFDGSLLKKVAKVIPSGTGKVVVVVENKIVTFRADNDESNIKVLASISGEGEARSIYSWDDLLKYLKDVLYGTCVTARFRSDHPIELKTETQGIVAEFLFAPRIEAD